jgi:hypothetical protein
VKKIPVVMAHLLPHEINLIHWGERKEVTPLLASQPLEKEADRRDECLILLGIIRAVLQQDQTMSSDGDALRLARRQLSRICSTRGHQARAVP